jgi:hypothetical protein
MNIYGTREIDNRDSAQMYEYMEARIDMLKRRISELEEANHTLRFIWNEFDISTPCRKVTSERVKPFSLSREVSYDFSYAKCSE